MSSAATIPMDVDAFLVWAEGREGRWELRDGQPMTMAPERAVHALTKYAAQKSLPSVEHDLILDLGRRATIWHRRGQASAIETRILRDGRIRLDPPGLEAEVGGLFAVA